MHMSRSAVQQQPAGNVKSQRPGRVALRPLAFFSSVFGNKAAARDSKKEEVGGRDGIHARASGGELAPPELHLSYSPHLPQLLDAIKPLQRGLKASPEDKQAVELLAQQLEKLNPTPKPLGSPLLNGRWKLLYTTSDSILGAKRPALLRPSGPIYQLLDNNALRAANRETAPLFNSVTAELSPLAINKVAVQFKQFKLLGLITINAPPTARGELAVGAAPACLPACLPTVPCCMWACGPAALRLRWGSRLPPCWACWAQPADCPLPRCRAAPQVTYLDDTLRVSRGDKGNLFVLQMDDPTELP
jgi:hypothetical protein